MRNRRPGCRLRPRNMLDDLFARRVDGRFDDRLVFAAGRMVRDVVPLKYWWPVWFLMFSSTHQMKLVVKPPRARRPAPAVLATGRRCRGLRGDFLDRLAGVQAVGERGAHHAGERGHQDALVEVELLDRRPSSARRTSPVPSTCRPCRRRRCPPGRRRRRPGSPARTACRAPWSTNSPWKIGGISVPKAAQ